MTTNKTHHIDSAATPPTGVDLDAIADTLRDTIAVYVADADRMDAARSALTDACISLDQIALEATPQPTIKHRIEITAADLDVETDEMSAADVPGGIEDTEALAAISLAVEFPTDETPLTEDAADTGEIRSATDAPPEPFAPRPLKLRADAAEEPTAEHRLADAPQEAASEPLEQPSEAAAPQSGADAPDEGEKKRVCARRFAWLLAALITTPLLLVMPLTLKATRGRSRTTRICVVATVAVSVLVLWLAVMVASNTP